MSQLVPTASLTDLLLQCPHPFEEDTALEFEGDHVPNEPARWGKAFHLYLLGRMLPERGEGIDAEAALARFNLPSHLASDLKAGARVSADALRKFIGGDNPWKVRLRIELAETPRIISFNSNGTVDELLANFDEETHSYQLACGALPEGSVGIGGTPDYVLAHTGIGRTVLDLKTGDYNPTAYTTPERLGQLLTLACGFHASAVCVMHAPRPARPGDSWRVAFHATDVTPAELAQHATRVRDAAGRIGSGFLRTGPACRWCPAREDCPTQIADRLQKTTALMKAAGGLVPVPPARVDLGAFVEGSRKLEKLMKEAREEIRERVREGEIIEALDGRVYSIVKRVRRSLSIGSVERALGRVRGAKELERLEILECIEKVEYEELKAK